jgi:hypothetical protein
MSFLESGKEGLRWIAAAPKRSLSRAPGCMHCGVKLEMNTFGMYPLSGKCESCIHRVFDEDEVFDDLEY